MTQPHTSRPSRLPLDMDFPDGVTVREMINFLSTANPDALVVVSDCRRVRRIELDVIGDPWGATPRGPPDHEEAQVSTDHTARCVRIDARITRARDLLDMWINGNREHVLRELSFADGRSTGKAAARMVAALGFIGHYHDNESRRDAAVEILETIARELDRT